MSSGTFKSHIVPKAISNVSKSEDKWATIRKKETYRNSLLQFLDSLLKGKFEVLCKTKNICFVFLG